LHRDAYESVCQLAGLDRERALSELLVRGKTELLAHVALVLAGAGIATSGILRCNELCVPRQKDVGESMEDAPINHDGRALCVPLG